MSDGEIDIPGNGQLAAEALAELLDAGAAAHKQGSAGVVEPEVVVLYNADTGELADADGTPLSAAIIRWVLAAGLLRPFEVTERGDVLRAGHLLRYANRHQRRGVDRARRRVCVRRVYPQSRRHRRASCGRVEHRESG
ncbi:MAG: hypothetical protein V9E99_16360 [Microthrixaceae bacterium]